MLVDAFNDTDLSTLKEKVASYDGMAHRLEKVASINVEDRTDLTKEAFAWPDEKLFPIYTPAHALVSSVYLEGNDDVPVFVKEACEEACALFGMDVEIGGLEKVASEPEQLSAEDFLLPESRKLPVVDMETFIASKNVLEKVASDLDVRDIVVSHRQLVKKASEVGADVSDREKALGLYGHIDGIAAKSLLHDRYLHTGDNEYVKIAEDISGDLVYSKEKVAQIIFDTVDADMQNGLDFSPHDTISSMVVPGEDMDIVNIDGYEIPMEKIASIDSYDWTEIFPESVVEAMFESGSIDSDMLNDIVDSASGIEKEAMSLFIANKLR